MTTVCHRDHARMLLEINRTLNREGDLRPDDAFAAAAGEILAHAVHLIPAPVWLSLSVRSSPQQKPRTLAATADEAAVVDRVQYLVADGPCVDVLGITDDEPAVVSTDDVTRDPRWPGLGAALREIAAPVGAVTSHRLTVPTGQMSLNSYLAADAVTAVGIGSEPPDAGPRGVAAAAATVGLALSALQHRRRADNLDSALQSNRQIGAAMGILMARHRWTYEQAFDRMRSVSQNSNRKLRDVADEVVLTGTLPRGDG